MKWKFAAALVCCLVSAPLLFADEPSQRATNIKERLLEAELSAVFKVYEAAHILKLEAELEEATLPEGSEKSKSKAIGDRIKALDVAIGKLRTLAERNEAELLKYRASESADRPIPLLSRVYKLNQLDDNMTEHAFAKMLNAALERIQLPPLENPDLIERGSGWLRVTAAQDQLEVVDRVMFSRHDAPE